MTTYDRFGNRTNPTIDVSGKLAAVAVDANGKIYVGAGNLVTAWNSDGSQTTPTIALGSRHRNSFISISGVAVDANGKIYVSSLQSHGRCEYSCLYKSLSRLTAYNPDGSRATPPIRLIVPIGTYVDPAVVGGPAIDANGKIYVVKTYYDTLRTYRPGGSPRNQSSEDCPRHGRCRRRKWKSLRNERRRYLRPLTTYTRDGSPTTPTITGLHDPSGVAIH